MEKSHHPLSGYIALLLLLVLLVGSIYAFLNGWQFYYPITAFILFMLILPGFFYINPNSSRVLTLFGKYIGTVKDNGFFWANPFYGKRPISLRARNFESERVKVNDKRGNPIMISVITVWRVRDTFKAAFEVEDYASFVKLQSDSAVRNLAGQYCYDNFDDDMVEITLRSGLEEINHALENALSDRL